MKNESLFEKTELSSISQVKNIKEKDKFLKKKNEFLEYMIRDEVYFADLEKIEDYYLRGTVHTYKNVNLQMEEKQMKLDKLKHLQDQIDEV